MRDEEVSAMQPDEPDWSGYRGPRSTVEAKPTDDEKWDTLLADTKPEQLDALYESSGKSQPMFMPPVEDLAEKIADEMSAQAGVNWDTAEHVAAQDAILKILRGEE